MELGKIKKIVFAFAIMIPSFASASDWKVAENSPFTSDNISGTECRFLNLDNTDLISTHTSALNTIAIANADFTYTLNKSSTGAGSNVTLQTCTNSTDTGTCTPFQADIDGDFISQDAVLTSSTNFLAATQSYLRALIDVAAVSPGNTILKVCGSTSDLPMTEIDPIHQAMNTITKLETHLGGIDIYTSADGPLGGGHAIQNAGSALAAQPILNFTGAGITCSDGTGETICDVPTSSGGVASARVLEINNPPSGSGLTVPSGAGVSVIPDPQLPGRVDDAAAINAAIQFACANNFDIAYLGEGHYRVGDVGSGSFPHGTVPPDVPATGIIFYSGVRIVADTCPNGIKFYGAGAGKTVLLPNASSGQNLITLTDFNHLTLPRSNNIRVGVNSNTNNNGSQINSFSNASPPVFTTNTAAGVDSAKADSHLKDGDKVHIRNCAGIVGANEREFQVFACNGDVTTGTAVTQCSLRSGDGGPVDSTNWGVLAAGANDSKCIITKIYENFDTEIAYMTLHDDAMFQHSGVNCVNNPGQTAGNCGWGDGEETHGIGSYVGGSRMNIHHISIENMGDEGIDVSAPEAHHWVHDLQIIDSQHGGVVISQGANTVLERMRIWKTFSFENPSSVDGTTTEPPYTTGNCWNIGVAGKNVRALNTVVKDIDCGGYTGNGWDIVTGISGPMSGPGPPPGDANPIGQYIENVSVIGGTYQLRPELRHCDDGVTLEPCQAFRIRSSFGAHPIRNVIVSGGVYSGKADVAVESGGVITIDNIKVRPIPEASVDGTYAITAKSPHLTISNNDLSGFAKGAIGSSGYMTNPDVANVVTTALTTSINATETIITVNSVTGFSKSSGKIRIGSEEIFFPTRSGSTLCTVARPCVRGVNSTTAASHTAADAVLISETATGAITTRITGNILSDMGGASGIPYIGRILINPRPDDDDEGYYDIVGNNILVGPSNISANVIRISQNGALSYKNVLIADNNITVHKDIATSSIGTGVIKSNNHNTTIRNNTVTAPANAIDVVLADNVTIEGNKLLVGEMPSVGSLKSNMRVIQANQSPNLRVINNELRGYSSISTQGITVFNDGGTLRSGVVIKGNSVLNTRFGIDIDGGTNKISNIQVVDNTIDSEGLTFSTAITMEDATDGVVRGNSILNTTSGSQSFAYNTKAGTDRIDVFNNFVTGPGLIVYGSNAGLGDPTCSATGIGAASECRNNFGTAESAELACREHWVQWVESGSNTHSVLLGFGGQLEHAEADFVKTSSSSDYASCWSWNFDPTKTGIVYNPAAATCPKSGASNIRFAYKVGGGASVARSILTTVTGSGSGLADGTNLNLISKIPGTSDQSLAGAVNQAGKFNGIGNENAWEGTVTQASRLALVAQGTTGNFTLTTTAATYLRVHTVDCGAP